MKLVSKYNRQYAMKIFQWSDKERDEAIKLTLKEVELVQSLNMETLPKYYKFVPEAIWHKKTEDVHCSYLLMEIVEGV